LEGRQELPARAIPMSGNVDRMQIKKTISPEWEKKSSAEVPFTLVFVTAKNTLQCYLNVTSALILCENREVCPG